MSVGDPRRTYVAGGCGVTPEQMLDVAVREVTCWSIWSGRRWPSGRHRVLPPQPQAPEEDLVSLIYFYEANHDALVTPLEPPIGAVSGLPPVTSSAFIKERLEAIRVG